MYSKHHKLVNIWLNSICDEVNINYLGLYILMVVNFFLWSRHYKWFYDFVLFCNGSVHPTSVLNVLWQLLWVFLFVYSYLTRRQSKYKDVFIEGQRERERESKIPIMNSLRANFN